MNVALSAAPIPLGAGARKGAMALPGAQMGKQDALTALVGPRHSMALLDSVRPPQPSADLFRRAHAAGANVMVGTRATAQAAQELEAEASKILSKDLKAPLESVIGIARDSVGPSGGNLSHSFEIIDQTRSALGQKLRTMMTQGVKRPGPPGSSMAHSGTTLTRRHATRQDQPGNCSGKA